MWTSILPTRADNILKQGLGSNHVALKFTMLGKAENDSDESLPIVELELPRLQSLAPVECVWEHVS